ncbi:hypothetical protein HK099_008499 [Clydaea vesicula]|uniref:Uncharacterized protein n=1 Tax=Clydaea vesicula TaxID=447962 RepID=A0AAD5U7T9_9FUNG|nr:hypothetical protein HK099_008499 [Clydaea vesicula]
MRVSLLLLLFYYAIARISFQNSNLSTTSFLAVPLVENLGFQGNKIVQGQLMPFNLDPCKLSNTVNQKVALIHQNGECTFETQYYNFIISGAIGAVFKYQHPGPPSLFANTRSPDLTTNKSMPFLTVSGEDYDALISEFNLNNVRAIPGLLYSIACLQSIYFLYLHGLNLKKENEQESLKFRTMLRDKFGIPHLVLFTEFVSTFILAFVTIVSSPFISAAVNAYFATLLSGVAIFNDILAAILWARLLDKFKKSKRKNFYSRFMKSNPVAELCLRFTVLGVPLALDTTVSVLLSKFYNYNHPLMFMITGSLFSFLQLIVGVHFLTQSIKFYRTVKSVRRDATESMVGSSREQPEIEKFLIRLNRVMLIFGITTLCYVILTPLAGTSFYSKPAGYILFWGGGGVSRAISSICRVNMFYPRKRSPNGSTYSSGEGESASNKSSKMFIQSNSFDRGFTSTDNFNISSTSGNDINLKNFKRVAPWQKE